MSDMGWEEKFAALQALASHWDAALLMRKPGDWYVSLRGVSIGGDGLLRSIPGDGSTPAAAIASTWREVSDLPADLYVVVERPNKPRRQVRWSGFMWSDVEPEVTP